MQDRLLCSAYHFEASMTDEDFAALPPADAYEHAMRQSGEQRVRLFKVYKRANGVEAQRGVVSANYKPDFAADPDPVKCPSCRSTQIHAEKRGWNIVSGLLGSSKIVLTCIKCGHRFAPGQGA